MTLIEVLVAFVVLSTTMAVVMQIFSGGMRNAQLSDGYTRAVFLAESKLASVGIEQPIVTGETTGEVGVDLKWRQMIEPHDDGGAADNYLLPARLFRVTIRVTWAGGRNDRQVELSTLRLGPRQ